MHGPLNVKLKLSTRLKSFGELKNTRFLTCAGTLLYNDKTHARLKRVEIFCFVTPCTSHEPLRNGNGMNDFDGNVLIGSRFT